MPITSIAGVFCAGNISLDIPVWPVDKFVWGTTLWVESLETGVGGNGGNTSYTLARLGTPVRLFGMVGRDEQGDSLIRLLTQAGVDTAGVRRAPSPTNSTVCVVHSSGDRLFLHRLGASSDVTPDVIQLEAHPPGPCSHFHLANLFSLPHLRRSAPEVLAGAHRLGLTTSLDTGWDARGEWMELVAPCLAHTDLLFVNESEAKMLTGASDPAEIAGKLRAHGASSLVLKLGGQGCIAFDGAGVETIAPYRVNVVDTTGAGDCFAAGFLSAIHRGFTFAEAARFANAVGALSVEKLGAVTGVRGFEETLAWMAAQAQLH